MSDSIADLMPLAVAGVTPLAAGHRRAFELRAGDDARVARVHARRARLRAHAERAAAQVFAVQRPRRARPLRDRGQARAVGPRRLGEPRRQLPSGRRAADARCRATTSRSPTRRARFLFIAGGIGITPIMSMVRHLANDGTRPFKLYYLHALARRDGVPRRAARAGVRGQGRLPSRWRRSRSRVRPVAAARAAAARARVLLRAAADAAGDPRHVRSLADVGDPLRELRRCRDARRSPRISRFACGSPARATTVDVGAHQSILEALRARGLDVPSSCESGTCGTCRTTPSRRRRRPSRSRAVGGRAGRQHHDLRVARALARARRRRDERRFARATMGRRRPRPRIHADAADARRRSARAALSRRPIRAPTRGRASPPISTRPRTRRSTSCAATTRRRRRLCRDAAPAPRRARDHRRTARQARARRKTDGARRSTIARG